MDAIFRTERFRNEITWQRTESHNTAGRYGNVADILLYYTKSKNATWNQQFQKYGEAQLKRFRHIDTNGRRYKLDDLTAPRPDSESGKFEWRGTKPSPTRGWGYKLEQLEEWWQEGRIHTKKDGTPRMDGLKTYLNETKGKPLQNIWTDITRIPNTSSERMGYKTQKPIQLLERVISVSSNEGDLILDPFCGCGTLIHAAEKLKRQWIGIDISTFSAGLMRERILSNFINLEPKDIRVIGIPLTVDDARQLARYNPFEFEKWVCGAIGAHGMFHEPGTKGSDGGVDGIINFAMFEDLGKKPKKEYALVQVKGGKVTPDSVRALTHSIQHFNAKAGIMVCFEDYMNTVENNRLKGTYGDLTGEYPVIQGFSVEQLLKNERPKLPPVQIRKDGKVATEELDI